MVDFGLRLSTSAGGHANFLAQAMQAEATIVRGVNGGGGNGHHHHNSTTTMSGDSEVGDRDGEEMNENENGPVSPPVGANITISQGNGEDNHHGHAQNGADHRTTIRHPVGGGAATTVSLGLTSPTIGVVGTRGGCGWPPYDILFVSFLICLFFLCYLNLQKVDKHIPDICTKEVLLLFVNSCLNFLKFVYLVMKMV